MSAAYAVYCSQIVIYIEKQSFNTRNDSARKNTVIHHNSHHTEKKKNQNTGTPQSNLYKSYTGKGENKRNGKNKEGKKIREKILRCSNRDTQSKSLKTLCHQHC